nr:reverse transcriptase domain-containing protein [Tanacetum cinerariifolium]
MAIFHDMIEKTMEVFMDDFFVFENFFKFVNSNNASTSSSGTLPSNTIANPRSDLKVNTTRSGVSYDGPQIPPSTSFLPKVVEDKPKATKDTVHPTNNESIEDVQPQVVQSKSLIFTSKLVNSPTNEPAISPVSAPRPNQRPSIPYLSRIDFLLEEVDAFLAIKDYPTSPKVDQSYLDPKGDILLLEAFLNDDPSLPPPNQGNYPPEAVLKGDDKLPVIIAKDLSMEEKNALITVLKSYKRAISDIKGIDLGFYTHKILMEKDFEPAIQHQIRVNHKIHDVIKQEVLKLLEAGLIYPMIVLGLAQDNELILTCLVMGLRVCIDYHQEKTTVTCPYRTFAYHRMPFGLCNALGTFQRKLTETPILIAPDWDMPFELMCDASDFAIGAVLGQRQDKHFRPIHYASKTMTEAESNYTTTEKEILAVVYAFEKFRSYLIMNKSIVYMDHSTFKYLFAKKDSNSSEGVYQARKPLKFSRLATMDPLGDTMAQITQSRRFGTPRAIISDRGTHFYNDQFAKIMQKLGVTHRLATPYHPQSSGEVEVSNRGLKRILERTVGENHASWLDKLDDALWAFRAAYETPIGSGDHKKVQLNELNELRDQAYENSLIYKEKTKRLHDWKIKDRVFNIGDRVLLFNSRLKIFSGKLKSHWSGPFTISHVYPYGTVELAQPDGPNFKVNGHRLKHYFGEDVPKLVFPDL